MLQLRKCLVPPAIYAQCHFRKFGLCLANYGLKFRQPPSVRPFAARAAQWVSGASGHSTVEAASSGNTMAPCVVIVVEMIKAAHRV